MPITQEPIQAEVKPVAPKGLEQLVSKLIGNVPNLQAIQCIPLFDDRYRVNVRVLRDGNNMVKVSKILASYFVIYADNKIVGGDPITALA